MLFGEHTLQPALPVVDRLEGKALRTQAFAEQFAEVDIVIDDQHTIHSVSSTRLQLLMVVRETAADRRLYKTLRCLTNLYRTDLITMLEWICSRGGDMSSKRIAIWTCVVVLVAAAGAGIGRAAGRGWHGGF